MSRAQSRTLDGRVAIVTGSGRNIGRAIALALAREGACVATNGHSDRAALDAVVDEIHSFGGQAMYREREPLNGATINNGRAGARSNAA